MIASSIDRAVLAGPASAGVKAVAREIIDRADAARGRLERRDDPEALHDLRVSLRRLRSWLAQFREHLDAKQIAAALMGLRRIMGETGSARDAEVHVAWIDSQLRKLDRRHRAPLAPWSIELEVLRDRARERAQQTLESELGPLLESLRSLVGESPRSLRSRSMDADSTAQIAFAHVTSRVLRRSARQLAELVGAIRFPRDDERVHRVRIQAKNLRYGLEPVAAFTADGASALSELKSLQDLLGEMNDLRQLRLPLRGALERAALHRVSGELDSPDAAAWARRYERALWALQRHAEKRHGARMRQLEEWRNGPSAALFERLERVATELESTCRPQPLEIERRYLLRGMPPLPRPHEERAIEQGWLPGDAPRERLRRTRTAEGERFERTLKIGSGLSRIEWEQQISRETFEELWPRTRTCRIAKARYRVADGDLCWEIDSYTDLCLYVAEVELPSEAAQVRVPDWLAPYVECEVTDDPRFTSLSIALHGIPERRSAAASEPSPSCETGPQGEDQGPAKVRT